jgi:hypothetical protein
MWNGEIPQGKTLRVGFDIGGVISRYPAQMKELMRALTTGGVEVFLVTDMNKADALKAREANGLDFIPESNVLSANWNDHGDLCKTEVIRQYGLDVLIDDRPDYASSGDFIGLVLSPRPHVPYYHPTWKNEGTPAKVVPPEEYEEFLAWKARGEPAT